MQPVLQPSTIGAARPARVPRRLVPRVAAGVAAVVMSFVTFAVFVSVPVTLAAQPGEAFSGTLARGTAIITALAHLNTTNRKDIR